MDLLKKWWFWLILILILFLIISFLPIWDACYYNVGFNLPKSCWQNTNLWDAFSKSTWESLKII